MPVSHKFEINIGIIGFKADAGYGSSVKYIEGESITLMLDQEGICVSTRSACATGSLRASHVLTSIGCDYTIAQGTIIFSFGIDNTIEEVGKTIGVLKKSVDFLRSMSPLYQKKAG